MKAISLVSYNLHTIWVRRNKKSGKHSLFDGEMLIELDDRFDYGEDRWSGIGFLGLGIAVVVWTERKNNIIRIISARRANRHEQRKFEQYLSY